MTNLESRWAMSRVEAMADGTLPPGDEPRMRAAIARDPELRAALERAAGLRAELRDLRRVPVPRALRRRLWAIAANGRAAPERAPLPRWAWTSGITATAALVAATFAAFHAQNVREREAAEAMEQVEIAMTYLRRSSLVVGDHVARAMRTGWVTAAQASRNALADDEPRSEGD